jgi:hypothetical protein
VSPNATKVYKHILPAKIMNSRGMIYGLPEISIKICKCRSLRGALGGTLLGWALSRRAGRAG